MREKTLSDPHRIPSRRELLEYAEENGIPEDEAEQFRSHYVKIWPTIRYSKSKTFHWEPSLLRYVRERHDYRQAINRKYGDRIDG